MLHINKKKLTTDIGVNKAKLKYHTMGRKKQNPQRWHTDYYIYMKCYKSQSDRINQQSLSQELRASIDV